MLQPCHQCTIYGLVVFVRHMDVRHVDGPADIDVRSYGDFPFDG